MHPEARVPEAEGAVVRVRGPLKQKGVPGLGSRRSQEKGASAAPEQGSEKQGGRELPGGPRGGGGSGRSEAPRCGERGSGESGTAKCRGSQESGALRWRGSRRLGALRSGGIPVFCGPDAVGALMGRGAPSRLLSRPGSPARLRGKTFRQVPGKERVGARVSPRSGRAEHPRAPRCSPCPTRSPCAGGSGGRAPRGRAGRTRTRAASSAPPQAASTLRPTLQQVAAAPRAPAPSLPRGPALAGGPQYRS